jgi:hypothetical protein
MSDKYGVFLYFNGVNRFKEYDIEETHSLIVAANYTKNKIVTVKIFYGSGYIVYMDFIAESKQNHRTFEYSINGRKGYKLIIYFNPKEDKLGTHIL